MQAQVGGRYLAKVSGKLATVQVDAIRETSNHRGAARTCYDVTNLSTGQRTTFRSAQRFRSLAQDPSGGMSGEGTRKDPANWGDSYRGSV